jgi:hypothetical protein
MTDFIVIRNELIENGFSIVDNVYSPGEVQNILDAINKVDPNKDTFRRSSDLFAIRQFLKEVPESLDLIFTNKLKFLILQVMGEGFFVVKSIYFDKLESSNWFVPYHQDLTISTDKKVELDNFKNWTTKQNQFAVQPPLSFLENIFTIRIHLDDTDEKNGALKVIPRSHLKNQTENIFPFHQEQVRETYCNVMQGGIMLMKPLTLHSSDKTVNNKKRRVIHIEFSNMELPSEIKWSERINLSYSGAV